MSVSNLKSPILICGPPKCGNHLLRNIFSSILGDEYIAYPSDPRPMLTEAELLHTNLENKIYAGHFFHSKELLEKVRKIPKIVLIRDPRDSIVSHVHFLDIIKKKEQRPINIFFRSLPSFHEKASSIIFGITQNGGRILPLDDSYIGFAIKWLDSKSFVIRYEDIFEARYSKENAVETIASLCKFIGIESDEKIISQKIAKGADPSKSVTFHTGKVGDWHSKLTREHLDQIERVAPNLTSGLGYTRDENRNFTDKNTTYNNIDVDLILNSNQEFENRYEQIRKTVCYSSVLTYLVDGWAMKKFFDNGSYDKAILILDDLLKYSPNSPDWNYYKGFSMHITNKDPHEALIHYKRALEYGHNEFWVRYNRGSLYYSMGKIDEAKSDLKAAFNLNPFHNGVNKMLMLINEKCIE